MLHASAFLKWDPKRHLCQLKAGFSVLSDSKLYNRCPKTVFVYFLLYIDYQMIAYNQKRRQKRIIFDSELWKGQIQMSSLIWAYSKAHHWIIFLIWCLWFVLTAKLIFGSAFSIWIFATKFSPKRIFYASWLWKVKIMRINMVLPGYNIYEASRTIFIAQRQCL